MRERAGVLEGDLVGVVADVSCKIVSYDALTRDEVRRFCLLKDQHWPHSVLEQERWWNEHSALSDQFVSLYKGGGLVAFLRLRQRIVICEGDEISAYCATEVCVDQGHIGSGLGRYLLKETTNYIDRSQINVAYLLCSDSQASFYEKCGWHEKSDVDIQKNVLAQSCRLASGIKCFCYDPGQKIRARMVLIGDVF